jgi:hypothetical protein
MHAVGGGIGDLLFTAWELAEAYFCAAVEAKYLLTNPSIVRGLRDYEWRQPIMVFI